MEKLRAIIIDDELNLVQSLEQMLNEFCPEIDVVATETTFNTGIESIIKLKPDILFLDIEMPHGTGFDLLLKLPERNFEVIFVTAYSQYAIQAIKFSALDYILKPVNIDELIKAVKKVSEKQNDSSFNKKFEVLLHNLKREKPTKISIPTSNGLEYVDISDIVRITADGRYSTVFLSDKKQIVVTKNIGEFENILAESDFFRIHKSHLVNLNYVKKYSRTDGGIIVMTDKKTLPLSKNKKDGFIQQMNLISK